VGAGSSFVAARFYLDPAFGQTGFCAWLDARIQQASALAYASCCGDDSMQAERHVRLFRNGRNQALRIPREFELPGNEAVLRRDGDRLVIEPVKRKRNLLEILATLEPLDETLPEIDDPPVAGEDIF